MQILKNKLIFIPQDQILCIEPKLEFWVLPITNSLSKKDADMCIVCAKRKLSCTLNLYMISQSQSL